MTDKKFDWDKFDKQVDLEDLQDDVKDVEENGFDGFKEIPDGEYEVAIDKMEMVESKKGDPMLTIWFEIVDGDYEGQKIFYNGVMQPQNDNAFGIQTHRNNEMLRGIWDCDKDDVKFTGFADYAEMVLDIHEEVDDKFEYLLSKTTDKKGYDQYEITEVFDLD